MPTRLLASAKSEMHFLMWLIVCVRDGEAGELPFRGAPLHTVRCENDLNKRALRDQITLDGY